MITVLSPHIDDAAYALAMTLERFALKGETIDLVNCFTGSEHAPHLRDVPHENISALRTQEDQVFLARLGKNAFAHYLGLPDTSVRREYNDLGSSFHRREYAAHEKDVLRELVVLLRRHAPIGTNSDPVFVPLAYGNHVDHRLVRTAAEECFVAERLVYYEDMPYSHAAPRRMLRKHLAQEAYKPVVVPGDEIALRAKDAALRAYLSQLEPDHHRWILERAKQLGGERVWLRTPSYEALWA